MSDATKQCPVCGEMILAVAKKCRYCGEYFDPSLKPRDAGPSSTDRLLMPVGRPASAIAAGYLGLFSFFPLVGCVTGLLAVVLGIKALKEIRDDPELSGKGRAWFGIIAGGVLGLLNFLFIVLMVIGLAIGPNR